MKRITWWPQAWLGMVFSWAALVGWSEVAGALTLPGLLLYAGAIAWVIGYDTIYALQDREDRSEEHTSELQSLMRISYAVFCLKKKKVNTTQISLQDSKNKYVHHCNEY